MRTGYISGSNTASVDPVADDLGQTETSLYSDYVRHMNAPLALRSALREIVSPFMRASAFDGSPPTWRTFNSEGDCAVVNVQSSVSSRAKRARCVVNIAVAPRPWVQWCAYSGIDSKLISAASGLYRDRLYPSGSVLDNEVWWELSTQAEASLVAADIVRQLQANGLPRLKALLDRANLLQSMRDHDLGFFKGPLFRKHFDKATAVLLSEYGPSAELEHALRRIESDASASDSLRNDEFVDWIRGRIAHFKQRAIG